MTDYGFKRVSTGSQDDASQERDIKAVSPCAVMRSADTKAASASKGEHLDAIDRLIAELVPGDRVLVTDSSRLDRDPDQWAQMRRLIEIKSTGATVVDLSNPSFGSDDKFGVVMTALHQMGNAEKSRVVKDGTWRGVQSIIVNKAFYGGVLPMFWATRGERYSKQAYCTDLTSVTDVYERIADGESISSVARAHDLYPQSIRTLIRFTAHHTGVITCQYTHDGETVTWSHMVEPVVDSPLWWRANKALDARAPKQGRQVEYANNWISGVLDCPECGGKLYLNAGNTPQGHPRTPKLRCGGMGKRRLACGKFRGCDAVPVIDKIESMFAENTTEIMAFQRISGNAHELDNLRASLTALQARLSATEDDDELDALIAERKRLRAAVGSFTIIPDSFDYAPTGQTVGAMWTAGDDTTKRAMLRAVKNVMGLDLNPDASDVDRIYVGILPAEAESDGIVDLGGGICFRRDAA